MTRLAALYDIHGNLPALEAVLEDVRLAGAEQLLVGGDVLPGPMPNETLRLLLDLNQPTHFLHGNGDLAVLAQKEGARNGSVSYWGTVSGRRPPESVVEVLRWNTEELDPNLVPVLSSWPKTLAFDLEGLGRVLFCHSTPRSETEVFTQRTTEERLLPLFEPLAVDVVICGHTHMQFDRRVGKARVVNAGSVGAPFGEPGAYWLLLGADIELRRTLYDFEAAAQRIRATAYPQAEEFAAQSVLHPPTEETMLETFAKIELSP